MWTVGFIALLILAGALTYAGRTKLAWLLPLGIAIGAWGLAGGVGGAFFNAVVGLVGVLAILLGVPAVRRQVVTPHVMRALARVLPRMSDTERIALEAGTVWWDADLFSGNPDWKKWLRNDPPRLTERERAFIDGPLEELCERVSDWELASAGNLPEEVWEFLGKTRLFGMIIPEQYGGLGFSAQAHSAVVMKLASRSTATAVTVMVPNSLGPAELLLHYGTEDQKNHFLPRLATGEEIPCFALTEPGAGSDASSMRSHGVVERGTYDGEEVVGIRLQWDKRYITLAPVATILGLAFRLYDPAHLIGDTEDLGITCALIPVGLPGIDIGKRHDPLSIPFLNGPTRGKDVFIPVDFIIGGPKMAGRGWMMLMQCLSAGRGISLPSLSAGAAQLSTRVVGAYATVREQFSLPIGRFEGVQEAMSRIGGLTYAVDAVRSVTAAGIDAGQQPSVISAIAKAYSTETMRRIVNDAMDISGGAGISLGPMNTLGRAYMSLPISITVEGANILTRTMIIFGQGALRCHPYAQHEVRAVAEKDVAGFDRAFFGHLGFVATNEVRTWLLAVTDGRLVSPPIPGPTGRYFQRLSRLSATFAFVSDVAMGTLGGSLKRRERLTGRLADALSWMYIASATLKRYVDEGQTERDRPYAEWALDHALHEIQTALLAFLDNLPSRVVGWGVRLLAFPFGGRYAPPSDRLGARVASGLIENGEARRHLASGIYVPPAGEPGLGRLEDALAKIVAARDAHTAVKRAIRSGALARRPAATLYRRALDAGILTEDQHRRAEAAEHARAAAVAVDEFTNVGHAPPTVVTPAHPASSAGDEPGGRAPAIGGGATSDDPAPAREDADATP